MPDETRTDAQPTPEVRPSASTTGGEAPATNPIDGTAASGRSRAPSTGDAFTLLTEIARGGMGVVFRARDNALGREVAVKMLQLAHPDDSPAAKRFWDEARITSQLQHPGIPPIYQVGTFPDGRPFLAMKLIKGDTLADLVASGGKPNLIAAFEQVCHALGYAHSKGVIHRDLKPGNVMVGAFGEVQVMDWGLAKVLGAVSSTSVLTEADDTASVIRTERDDDFVTRAGSVLGTPAYMPPEQAIGAIDQIDQRSDVFGLGAILAAVLTGQPPFVGGNPESTRQLAARGKVEDCFTRLDACGAEPELVALCKRCLSPEKANRPAHGGEVAADVGQLRAAADERARHAELDRVKLEGERAKAEAEAREQRKRRKVQLALAGVVGLLLAVGGAFAWYSDHVAQEGRRKQAEFDAGLARAESERLLRDQAELDRVARGGRRSSRSSGRRRTPSGTTPRTGPRPTWSRPRGGPPTAGPTTSGTVSPGAVRTSNWSASWTGSTPPGGPRRRAVRTRWWQGGRRPSAGPASPAARPRPTGTPAGSGSPRRGSGCCRPSTRGCRGSPNRRAGCRSWPSSAQPTPTRSATPSDRRWHGPAATT